MRQPTIEWQVAGACNYDCSYCIQSKAYRRGRPSRDELERAIQFFAQLPGRWELKASGGEAFAHPLFLEFVVPALMAETPHTLSVLTNLSSTREELSRFVALTRGRLAVFSASLHLEFVTAQEFVEKARWLASALGPEVRLVVNQVVLPGREAEALAAKGVVEAAGLRWFPQLYKEKGERADDPSRPALLPIFGRAPTPRTANLAPSYQGRWCWAGVDYFVVDKDGEAYACRTAKRHGEGSLGNVYRGDFTRAQEPVRCPYPICPCTVPANRGMIEGVPAAPGPAEAEG